MAGPKPLPAKLIFGTPYVGSRPDMIARNPCGASRQVLAPVGSLRHILRLLLPLPPSSENIVTYGHLREGCGGISYDGIPGLGQLRFGAVSFKLEALESEALLIVINDTNGDPSFRSYLG